MCAFFREILPIIGIGAVAVLIRLAYEKAVGVGSADLFEGNRAGERDRHGVLLVVRPGGIVVRAVPDGTQEFPFNRRLCVRPVRNVNDRLLHATLNNVERISSNKDVDLTLRQFCRPSEECGDEIMVGHSAALKVLRRCKVVRQTMQLQSKCSGDLGSIARHLCPLHVDMDGRVEERVLTVRSLDRLHDAALTGFLHKKTEGIVHHTPLDTCANGERAHGFELDVVGKREFAERHRERANAALSKLCVGKRMQYLNSRICKNPRLPNESALRISKSHIAATDASLCVTCCLDLLYNTNVAQGIRMRGDGCVKSAQRISAHLHGLTECRNHRGVYERF